MIKECKIISYNKYQHIAVVDFDGVAIQITAALSDNDTVAYVKKENRKYSTVSKHDFDKQAIDNKKNVGAEKTEKNVKNIKSDM